MVYYSLSPTYILVLGPLCWLGSCRSDGLPVILLAGLLGFSSVETWWRKLMRTRQHFGIPHEVRRFTPDHPPPPPHHPGLKSISLFGWTSTDSRKSAWCFSAVSFPSCMRGSTEKPECPAASVFTHHRVRGIFFGGGCWNIWRLIIVELIDSKWDDLTNMLHETIIRCNQYL